MAFKAVKNEVLSRTKIVDLDKLSYNNDTIQLPEFLNLIM